MMDVIKKIIWQRLNPGFENFFLAHIQELSHFIQSLQQHMNRPLCFVKLGKALRGTVKPPVSRLTILEFNTGEVFTGSPSFNETHKTQCPVMSLTHVYWVTKWQIMLCVKPNSDPEAETFASSKPCEMQRRGVLSVGKCLEMKA